jgi:hypothetical protein
MSEYSQEEIALILQAAAILKQHDFSQQLNVSQFCREAKISRKNAYKHKQHFDLAQHSRDQQLQQLQARLDQLEAQLKLAERRAADADLYWELRNILVALNADYKKKGPGQTPRRRQLIGAYNRIADSLGLAPLSCWE